MISLSYKQEKGIPQALASLPIGPKEEAPIRQTLRHINLRGKKKPFNKETVSHRRAS